MFADRAAAGRTLAEKLERYRSADRGADAIVLALPRGGVVVGAALAKALDLPLDIVVTRKVGHPDNPEYAVCAVDERGTLLCDEDAKRSIPDQWLATEIARQQREAARRTKLYRGGKPPAAVNRKTVILTDDGIATGLTVRLAVRAVRAQNPARIVVAVPVSSAEAVAELERGADEVIVLDPPEHFLGAVGAHYANFEQVDDDTVIRLLGSV